MSVTAVVAVGLLVTVALGLALAALVWREGEDRPAMDRQQAERVARRDTPDDDDGTRDSRRR